MDRREELAELARTWTPPPGLSGSVMREVKLSGSGVALTILAALFVLGGITLGIFLAQKSTHESAERALLETQGRDVEARITKLWRDRDKEQSPRVTYEFQVDGRTYGRAAHATLKVWKTLSLDSPLPIRYLPSDPFRSQPRDWTEPILPIVMAPLLGLVFAAFGILFAVMIQRQKTLLRIGRPAPAIVIRTRRASHNRKVIHYEFPLLGGSIHSGRSASRGRAAAVGDTLCIVYDRDNPRRNSPYPLEFVKLAPRG